MSLLGVPLGVLVGALLKFLRWLLGAIPQRSFKGYSGSITWVLRIGVYYGFGIIWIGFRVGFGGFSIYPNNSIRIFIVIIVVFRHSCDASLTEGRSEIIPIFKVVNKQQLAAVSKVFSVACGKNLNTLDDPVWKWELFR